MGNSPYLFSFSSLIGGPRFYLAVALLFSSIVCTSVASSSSPSIMTNDEKDGASVPLFTSTASSSGIPRSEDVRSGSINSLPLGEAYDIVVPSSVPLGILLDKHLFITSFRSPIEEQRLQSKIDNLRAKPSLTKGSAVSSTAASDSGSRRNRPSTDNTDGVVSSSSFSSSVPSSTAATLNEQLTLSYSIAEYTGIVKIGDKLIAINNEPIWKLSLAEVIPLLSIRSTNNENFTNRTRTVTFLRPFRSRTLSEWSSMNNPTLLPSSSTSLPYAQYIRKVAHTLKNTRPPSESSVPVTSTVHETRDQSLTYNVTINIDQFIGALFSKDLVLLSTNPMDTERFYAVLQNETVESTSASASDGRSSSSSGRITTTVQLSRLHPSIAISLLLRRGQLSGKAWAGDTLIAINGESVSESNGVKQLYTALDISLSSFAIPDDIIALHSQLKNYSLYVNDSDTVTLFSGDSNNRDDNTNDVLCIGSGYYCISTNDIDNVQALSVLTTLQTKQLNSTYYQSRHSTSSSSSSSSASPNTLSSTSNPTHRTKVTLTFKRASYLPVELLPSSRYGAITNALYRLTQNSTSNLISSSRTSSILSSLPKNQASNDDTGNEAVSVMEELDQLITSSFTCYSGRCSFRAADRIYLRTKSITSSRILSTTLSDEDKAKDKAKPRNELSGNDEDNDDDSSKAVSIRKKKNGTTGNATTIHARNELFTIGIPALFGGAYSCIARPVVYAYPNDACSRLKTSKGGQEGPPPSYAGAIVLVERGTCTFPQKALQIQASGGSAMIVINTDNSPPIAMPGNQAQGKVSSSRPKTEEQLKAEKQGLHPAESNHKPNIAGQVDDTGVAIAACMVTKEAGQLLKEAIKDGRKDGYTTSGSFITSTHAEYDLCNRKKTDTAIKETKTVPMDDDTETSGSSTVTNTNNVWNTTLTNTDSSDEHGRTHGGFDDKDNNSEETIDPHELARFLSLSSKAVPDDPSVQWIDLSSLSDRFDATVQDRQESIINTEVNMDGQVPSDDSLLTNNNNNNNTFVMV